MTKWTPEIEKLIRKFAAYEAKQMKDGINPKASVAASVLRIGFRQVAMGGPLYKELCKEMGVKASMANPVFAKNVQMMIDVCATNGSDAAKDLIRAREIWTEAETYSKDGIERIKISKQKNLKF